MIFHTLPVFMFLYLSAKVIGKCHTCQSNFAVCHDERRFTMCTEGIPDDEMYTCPSGYVCTAETEICLKSSVSNPVEPSCEESCGLCSSSEKLFACLDETTYVYCFGEELPDYSAVGFCPDGYVCNLGSNQVCSPASEVYPSCYEGASRGPTTLSPPTTENSYSTDATSTINPTDETEPVTDSKTSDSSSVTTELTTNPGIVTTDGVTGPVTDQSTVTESPTPTQATTDDPTTASSPLTDSPTPIQTTTDVSTTLVTSPSTESTTPIQTTTDLPTTFATQPTLSTKNPRDESAFCKEKQNGGLYKAEGDPTCKEFVLCYTLSGQYLGLKYTCPSSQFFNESTKKCQGEKPIGC